MTNQHLKHSRLHLMQSCQLATSSSQDDRTSVNCSMTLSLPSPPALRLDDSGHLTVTLFRHMHGWGMGVGRPHIIRKSGGEDGEGV